MLFAVIDLLVLGAMLYLASRIVRALVGLAIPLLLGLGCAVSFGAAVALWVAIERPALDAGELGGLAGAALFPVAVIGIGWWCFRRRAEARLLVSVKAPAEQRPVDPLDAAWWDAERFARAETGRIAAARRDCASLLHEAEAQPLDWPLVEWAEVIRRTIPDLVGTALAAAEEGEDDAIAHLVRSLEQIAEQARKRLGITSARARFAVLRAHIACRSGAGGL